MRIERYPMRSNNRIPLETLRRSLGRVAQDVERGGSVVVERRGEEAFALVPMRLYRLLEEERRALVESTRQARETFSDLSEGEVGELVEEELEATRGRATPSVEGAADR
jgi:prevent-host-death family protein